MKTLTTLVLSALLTVGCSMTGQVQAEDDYFSQAELDSMLAPVALYPDSVLSHVLIAATYPLEVIQAARWSREHPGLRGEDAVAAVERRNWDPSVKALVAFPELLRRMDEDLDWTQDLGDAFLVQEEDVIASIQYLRSEAYSQGHLKSNDRVKVVREKEYIYIEPARTRVVYVPYYDPRVIYSSWRWSSHPPRYWHRPSGFSVSMNFHWGRPYHIRPNFYFSSFHWAQRRVVVVNHHHHYYRDHGFRSGRDVARFKQARHWKHDPTHRRGVSYRGRVEQTRFVDNSRPASARVSSSASSRAVVRSEKRDWAAERRSSIGFDRQAESRARASSRSERAVESRGSDRAASRVESRARSSSRVAERSSDRAAASQSREGSRSVTGRAPERAAARSGSTAARSSADRSNRVSESLRSSSRSRDAVSSQSRGAERSSEGARSSNSRGSGRSSAGSASRSDSKRSSVPIPRDLSVRSSNARERSSSPSRSSRSSTPSRGASIGRSSAPSRESAPSRSRSSNRSAAPSRSTPSVRSSAPSRSSNASAPSRGSRSSAPSRSSKSSAPSRSSGTSTRSSRGGDSGRRGRGGEERR